MSSIVQIDAVPTNDTLVQSEHKQVLFVICDNCFWCCSLLSIRQHEVNSCPQCKEEPSKLPIANNEAYTYEHTPSRGVELSFRPR
jgi:predicted nucleic acid-binding Zn ribbon protein